MEEKGDVFFYNIRLQTEMLKCGYNLHSAPIKMKFLNTNQCNQLLSEFTK